MPDRAAPDRVAIVTGAARGIGAAIAHALAAGGTAVAVCDLDGDGARAVAADLVSSHGTAAVGLPLDVTVAASVAEAVASATVALGPISVLVNNAGVDVVRPFADTTEADWAPVVAVNLLGTIRCTHAVLGGMIERRAGRIVSIGSDAGKVGSSGEVVYSAAKGGVIAFTKALAREVARHGITVNCVCPGPTDTALLGQVADSSPGLVDALARAVPLRRIAQPGDIAPAVAFLAGDGAAYITGQALSVSGGLTMC